MPTDAPSPTDPAALQAQAAGMAHAPAIRHLRLHTGCSLKEGARLTRRIADDRPDSPLARSRAEWDEAGRRNRLILVAGAVGLIVVLIATRWLAP